MSFGGGSKGPSAAQIQAQETQSRLAAEQERQLKQQETERLASMRARAGRMGGRSLLMMDETGFFADQPTGLQKRLGSGWRDRPANGGAEDTPAPPNSGGLMQGAFTQWLRAA